MLLARDPIGNTNNRALIMISNFIQVKTNIGTIAIRIKPWKVGFNLPQLEQLFQQ